MQTLSDDERQQLLRLISGRLTTLSGRVAQVEYQLLVALRRKLEGVDKRIVVDDGK